jgi:drug/metabolite transporter (DMT)-like permease
VGLVGWIGLGAVAVLALGWLVVSFSRRGPRRDTTAWVATVAMYVALLCLFTHLTSRSWDRDSTAGLVGFGFLATVFAIGLVLATVRTIGSLRGRSGRDVSATH